MSLTSCCQGHVTTRYTENGEYYVCTVCGLPNDGRANLFLGDHLRSSNDAAIQPNINEPIDDVSS